MFTKSPLNQQQNVQSVRLFDTSDVKLRDGIKIPVKTDKNPEKTDKLRERKQTQLQPHTAHNTAGDFVLDGDRAPSPPQKRGGFRPMFTVAKRLDGSRCCLAQR